MPIDVDIIVKLEESNFNVYFEGVEILLKLINNVIKEPGNSVYRVIRKENKNIKNKLLVVNGMYDVLLHIGYIETIDTFHLPSNILIADLKKFKILIEERKHIQEQLKLKPQLDKPCSSASQNGQSNVSGPVVKQTGAIKKKRSNKINPSRPYHERIAFVKVIPTGNMKHPFLKNLESTSDQVMQYEDAKLKSIGKQIIPLEKLTVKAMEKLRNVQKSIKNGSIKNFVEPCLKDYLLVELVDWFKNDFFTWIDSLPCKICGAENIKVRGNYVDINGINVETYTCCNQTSKFYRYNDVAKLLLTRRGRCGEFANCFTFFCRCLDYDARLVYATFDHVWTEVYSVSQHKWLHIDPSDNVIDAPLMYQHGWKRCIDYIIGFSKDDVQDVTFRYSNMHNELMQGRNVCTENDLINVLLLLRKKRQEICSMARLKYLKKRTLFELVELMIEREPTNNEKNGRSSGGLAWKLSRGEQRINNFYVFNPLSNEINAKQFNLRYSCANDIYERYIQDQSNNISVIETHKKWETCHCFSSNIFRKEERDWKMVYLARAEDSNEADISWKFDFSVDNLKIKDISLKFENKTYENGVIDLMFLNEIDENVHNLENLRGLTKFSIKAILSGGKGDVAWQHTQLFRQRIGSTDYPFQLNVKFY